VTVPIAELDPGDRVRVTPGERVPIDGTVIEGTADLDESVITGESLPVRKGPGETVIGGATLLSEVDEAGENEVDGGDSAGAIVMQVGEDAESTADRLAAALWEVQTATPGIQRFVDKLATVFVPVVLTLGAIVAGWRLATGTVAAAMLAGLTVLVVSCPCAMGLATPLAVSGGRDALSIAAWSSRTPRCSRSPGRRRRSCSIKRGRSPPGRCASARHTATIERSGVPPRSNAAPTTRSRTRSERRRPTTIWRASTPLWPRQSRRSPTTRLGRLGNAR